MVFLFFNQSNSYLNDPDVQRMLAFKKGDKTAFETLLTHNKKKIYSFILRMIKNPDTADDLTQDVFIQIYKTAWKYKPKAKFQTWAFQIARNLTLNEIRRQKHDGYSLDAGFGEDGSLSQQVEDVDGKTPFEELAAEEQQRVVRDAIASLPEKQRIAVILRRYEKLSYDDIAQVMKTTSKAVKSLLNRAKENLQQRLKNFY